MPSGGKRPGAGRKKGAYFPHKKNRLPFIASAATRQRMKELAPLDVMVKAMNAFLEAGAILGSKIVKVDDKIVVQLDFLKKAAEIAKDCAPYVHSKMPTKVEGTEGDPIKHHITVELVKGAAPR